MLTHNSDDSNPRALGTGDGGKPLGNFNTQDGEFKRSFANLSTDFLSSTDHGHNRSHPDHLDILAETSSNPSLAGDLMSVKFADTGPLLRGRANSSLDACRRGLYKSLEDVSGSMTGNQGGNRDSPVRLGGLTRSLTMRDLGDSRAKKKSVTTMQIERLKQAKVQAEEAIKTHKVFMVIGPYQRIREALRNRGWVEKFPLPQTQAARPQQHQASPNHKKGDNAADDSDDGDDDDGADDGDDGDYIDENGGSRIPPWEEEDGIYGIMSRIVRNAEPTLIWSLKKSQVDFKFLKKDQIVNHHAKAHSFTTKIGLCRNLHQLRWFHDQEPDEFFPRCYVFTMEDDKQAFIDDFRLTACMALVKLVGCGRGDDSDGSGGEDGRPEGASNGDKDGESPESARTAQNKKKLGSRILPKIRYVNRRESATSVPQQALEIAITHCESFLKTKNHDDIDDYTETHGLTDGQWDQFINWYYKVVHENATIQGSAGREDTCRRLCHHLKEVFPQFEMDGYSNVWIVKPGAKSRGRGITCYNRLEDMLKLVSYNVPISDGRYVVQKYIERPLLIYKTKFDIRQWVLVADWNPLTIWWYQDCYLRFCSQQFTLHDFNEAVHLSNNSIQYKYENGPRSSMLPDDNMWDSQQFEAWLRRNGHDRAWDDVISPGMRQAVISSLLCAQDIIAVRKNCFELYGADFMITADDFRPWLLEINSSPCMAPSTTVTARLTANVLEDTMKVIVDRRQDRNCDVGRFELIYKQATVSVPPYIGIDLRVAGTQIRRPWNCSTVLDNVPIRSHTGLSSMTLPSGMGGLTSGTGAGSDGTAPVRLTHLRRSYEMPGYKTHRIAASGRRSTVGGSAGPNAKTRQSTSLGSLVRAHTQPGGPIARDTKEPAVSISEEGSDDKKLPLTHANVPPAATGPPSPSQLTSAPAQLSVKYTVVPSNSAVKPTPPQSSNPVSDSKTVSYRTPSKVEVVSLSTGNKSGGTTTSGTSTSQYFQRAAPVNLVSLRTGSNIRTRRQPTVMLALPTPGLHLVPNQSHTLPSWTTNAQQYRRPAFIDLVCRSQTSVYSFSPNPGPSGLVILGRPFQSPSVLTMRTPRVGTNVLSQESVWMQAKETADNRSRPHSLTPGLVELHAN